MAGRNSDAALLVASRNVAKGRVIVMVCKTFCGAFLAPPSETDTWKQAGHITIILLMRIRWGGALTGGGGRLLPYTLRVQLGGGTSPKMTLFSRRLQCTPHTNHQDGQTQRRSYGAAPVFPRAVAVGP